MPTLINYLHANGFFTSPASIRFHGSNSGGLAEHSLGVYWLLEKYAKNMLPGGGRGQLTLPVKPENLIIAGLLHDVCKIGAYLASGTGYRWNRAQPKGHALLSLVRISHHIKLEAIEEMMIKFHMGVYGLLEFGGSYATEYHLRGDETKTKEERYGKSLANAWYHNPIVKLIYLCDELETHFTKEGGE